MRLVPVTFADASAFVNANHRHHRAPVGHKFCVGVADDDDLLVGVAIVGRPISRVYQDGLTLEVLRTCTDGSKNVNSMLYAACWNAAKALGWRRLVTYTQQGETGASLHAAHWVIVAERPPRKGWDTPSRRRENRNANVTRTLWEPSS